jgi:hypothetical protein
VEEHDPLVPAVSVRMPSSTLCVAPPAPQTTQSVPHGIPTRSVGTSIDKEHLNVLDMPYGVAAGPCKMLTSKTFT